MAIAEGTLVALTSRGSKTLNAGVGVTTGLTQDRKTRGLAFNFPSVVQAAECKAWTKLLKGYNVLKEAFESTLRFEMCRCRGIQRLYAGWGITVARSIPSSAIFSLIFDGLRREPVEV